MIGHISKANKQWHSFNNEEEVMVIFNGHHTYVSSSWYEIEEVPTWNYIAVHVYGRIRIQTEEELVQSLNRLMTHYEANEEKGLRMEDLSEQTLRQIKGVVGFEISITDIQAAYKLSQNRSDIDHQHIRTHLEQRDTPSDITISKAMQKHRK